MGGVAKSSAQPAVKVDVIRNVLKNDGHFTETRKQSLYSNFERLRDLNEDGFNANIVAWKQLLETAAAKNAFENELVIPCCDQVAAACSDGRNGTPLSLQCVFSEMALQGHWVPIEQYTAPPRGIINSVFGAPFRLLFGAVRSAIGLHQQESGYVCVEAVNLRSEQLVKELAAASRAHGETRSSRIFLQDKLAGSVNMSPLDLELCLVHLSRTGEIAWDEHARILQIPASAGVGKVKSHTGRMALSNEDRMLAAVVGEADRAGSREKAAATEAAKALAAVKEAVRTKEPMASKKLLLSRYQTARKAHERAAKIVSQLQTVAAKIDEADDSAAAVRAFATSSQLLSSLNSKADSVESVEEIMDKLRDEIEKTEEISSALGDLSLEDHEDDIERELDELLESKNDSLTKLENLNAPNSVPEQARADSELSKPVDTDPEPNQAVPLTA